MAWNWLNSDFVLDMLDNDRARQTSAYLEFMGQGDSEDIRKFYERKNLPSLLGKEDFIQRIKDRYAGEKRHHETPLAQAECLAPTIREIQAVVGEVYKMDVEGLLKMSRGFNNEARNVAVYLKRLYTGKSLEEIGRASNQSKKSSRAKGGLDLTPALGFILPSDYCKPHNAESEKNERRRFGYGCRRIAFRIEREKSDGIAVEKIKVNGFCAVLVCCIHAKS